MALLHRFTQLNDRSNTGIFTFIVTKSVTINLHRDATTKDFIYGYHRWAITFTRANEKALGVYLILRNPCQHSKCYADYSFTLLNKEHFSKNEVISEKQICFTTERPAQGVGKWILLSDIASRKFSDESGEFLLELSLSNILTMFEVDFSVSSLQTLQRNFKLETNFIQYNSFDWKLIIKPQESDINNEEFTNLNEKTSVNVYLNRLSGLDRLVRVKYRLFLGNGKRKEDSGVLDQISDRDGCIVGTQVNLFNLIEIAKTNKNILKFYFEMYCANPISEAKVGIVREQQPVINCYDRNKQGWSVEADFEKEHLRLKIFFMDLDSVPKNHLRFISFNLYVVTKNSRDDTKESISVKDGPHSNYYITDGLETGCTMDTDINSQEILKISPKDFLETDSSGGKQCMTIHVEWIDSIMLFNHTYHKYDDLARIHCHQMRREIQALVAENNSLERELTSYQRNPRGTPQPNANVQYNNQYSNQFTGVQYNNPTNSALQHRVSDPYILDNLTAPFNSLIKTGSSSNHPSPSHHSKSHQHSSQHSSLSQAHQIKTAPTQQQQPIAHQSTHQTHQQPQYHHQIHSTSQPQQTQQQQQTHLNKNASLTSIQQQQPTLPNQQQQINTINDSVANINIQQQNSLQNSYASNLQQQSNIQPANNSPTLTNLQQQHYQLQQQQMNLNQMPMNQMNWQQQQQNINQLMQHQIPANVNRSTMNMNQINTTTTTINPILNYNANQLINTSNPINMPNENLNQSTNQLNAGQLNRHLSNSTCNLNATYAANPTMPNSNNMNIAGMQPNNLMKPISGTLSTSNHNLANLSQPNLQYSPNSNQLNQNQQNLQRYQHPNQPQQPSVPHQLPNYRQQMMNQPSPPQNQSMMSRMYESDQQRLYLQQQQSNASLPKSPIYKDLNYN